MVCRESLQRGKTVAAAVKHRPVFGPMLTYILYPHHPRLKKAPLWRGFKFRNLASPSEG
jgi:hypothetical protein